MNSVQLGLRENKLAYRCGEEIAGAVHWELADAPQKAEVRLCWYTRGKGTEDVAIVETIPLETPLAGDMRPFSFIAPAAPHSFSGKLISLIWIVEIVLKPGDLFQRLEITISADGQEIVLPAGSAA